MEAKIMEGVRNVTNIDKENFEGMYGGEKIVLKKGKTKAFPETIANHLAGQLATKILIREDKDWRQDPRRPELIAQILGKVVAPPEEEAPEEAPEEAKEEAKEEKEFEELKKKKAKPKAKKAKRATKKRRKK